MGMGEFACYAQVIEWNKIKELCPGAASAFVCSLPSGQTEVPQEFAKGVEHGDWEDLSELFEECSLQDDPMDIEQEAESMRDECIAKWKELCVAFTEATTVEGEGLTLWCGHHNHDAEGSRYDDIDGVYFAVEGMYQLTPAGERFKDSIQEKRWTVFG